MEVEVEPVAEVTVYGGIKGMINNGTKKEGGRRKERSKFQMTVIGET